MKAFLVRTVISLMSALPLTINRLVGRFIGRLMYLSGTRMVKTSLVNLSICYPSLSESERKSQVYRSCLHTGQAVTEAMWLWKRPVGDVRKTIRKVTGVELIQNAMDAGRGVLLTGPHVGNWELISIWAAEHFPSGGMYRKPKVEALDTIIRSGRSKSGAVLFTGERKNARKMLEHLKSGKLFIILSDQLPAKGSGVYAPFYGRPAYTMTLVQKLIQKTNATMLMFTVERIPSGFHIKITQPRDYDPNSSNEAFAEQLNLSLMDIIEAHRDQFEWGYKRFKSPDYSDPDIYRD